MNHAQEQRARRPRDPARSAPAALAAMREELSRHRNADGGWGYYPGKASRIEPTCWALLANARAAGGPVEIDVLLRWPRARGWLTDVQGVPVNYAFQALAGLTMRREPAGAGAAVALATALLDVRGARFDQSPAMRQDNSLQAWPWIADTFSWVEPSSVILLLVKKFRGVLPRPAAAGRIDIGERMLLDRACASGGWNYGGSNVYGQELYAYVPTTAWGLLALQDRRQDPVVTRSLARLREDARTELSAQALAMAAVALRIFKVPAADVLDHLVEEAPRAAELKNVVGLAMNLYALARPADGDPTFSL